MNSSTNTHEDSDININTHKPKLFEEIIINHPNQLHQQRLLMTSFDEVEAYITIIQPKLCKNLLKELSSFLPLVKLDDYMKWWETHYRIKNNENCLWNENSNNDNERCNENEDWEYCIPLGHLRRVRRSQVDQTKYENRHEIKDAVVVDDEDKISPPTKRIKKNKQVNGNDIHLEVLIGSVQYIDHILQHHLHSDPSLSSSSKTNKLQSLLQKYNLELVKKFLPGRPAKSQSELNQWNQSNWWPTLYYEKNSIEYKEKEMELDIDEEYGVMSNGILSAITDARNYCINKLGITEYRSGAVIMCPKTKTIVSTSFNEMKKIIQDHSTNCNMQQEEIIQLLLENPLNTSVLFAIQGVSRKERVAAIDLGMDNDAFKENQVKFR